MDFFEKNMKKFTIKTLGCKTNQIESAIIEEKLLNEGFFNVTKSEDADYFILNSCSVTNSADNKALSTLTSVKKHNPKIITVLTGCFAQLESESLKNNPCIDILVGNQEKTDIAQILKSNKKYIVSDIFSHKDFRYEELNDLRKTRATIKIQDGCNNRCSYCTIPLARGSNRSNSVKNIIRQVNILAENGFEEVVFTGIHIGQWGYDFDEKTTLIKLLEEIEKTKITRYRLGSLNPLELNDKLVDFLANSSKFCPHFHLSLQSACDKTLTDMNRHYSFNLSYELISKLNEKFQLPFIGSDVIVGFPGESDEDFLLTYNNLKKSNISQIHVFPYSKRKNTKACDMPDQVSAEKKKERANLLKKLSEKKLEEFFKKNIGTTAEIIVEKNKDKQTGLYKGVTRNYINVLLEGKPETDCNIQKVKITGFSQNKNKLKGEIIS